MIYQIYTYILASTCGGKPEMVEVGAAPDGPPDIEAALDGLTDVEATLDGLLDEEAAL